MHPIHFEGARPVSKPETMTEEQCYTIWALPTEYTYRGSDGHDYPARYWTQVWQPSKEDMEAIAAGRPVILQIHSMGLPPVALFTLDENGNSNND